MIGIGEVIMLLQDIAGLIINSIMFYIIINKLRLKGMDLKLMSMIGILDCLFFINSIIRISMIAYYDQNLSLFPDWWCGWDSSITLITIETSYELVAILGLMRYFNICTIYKLSNKIWLLLSLLSFIISMSTTLGNLAFDHAFFWSASKLVCLPGPDSKSNNIGYARFIYLLFVIRFIISLLIIIFCYVNINLTYNKKIALNFNDNCCCTREEIVFQYKNHKQVYPISPISPLSPLSPLSFQPQDKNINKIKYWTTFKLLSIILAYIICILPNASLSLKMALHPQPMNPDIVTITHILNSFCGIVNPLFVLLVHEPSRYRLFKLLPNIKTPKRASLNPFTYSYTRQDY